ncbi:TraM recognition domain-containing protein (plasmid) [Erwinia pyri]|uniref:TraM recognition domain-containing protein n=1 Tax=Erwinia pyri TaxID=3062598 RepID=A0AA50DNJ9_9GAMM|nr:TraM recognition domain-containing protein [Erwinia sp. DE2]WLS81219.1 TraM recognition domain-containing protein [Erwinia sp. DE2]
MKELISRFMNYNIQFVTVTQDLSSMKKVRENTGKSVLENSNVRIVLTSDKTGNEGKKNETA